MTARECLRIGFLFFLFSIGAVYVLTFCLTAGDMAPFMDTGGWVFFVSACLSHAACFALLPYLLLFLPLAWCKQRHVALWVLCSAYVLLHLLLLINGYVFRLYRFHINGLVLDMLTGAGADEVFTFSAALYWKVAGMLLGIIAGNVFLLWLAAWRVKCGDATRYVSTVVVLLLLTLTAHGLHAYAAAAGKHSIIKSATYLPYYFPLTANTLMTRMGVVSSEQLSKVSFAQGHSDVNYPLYPIVYDLKPSGKTVSSNTLPNIVVIAIDSWHYQTLTRDITPNLYAFSKQVGHFTHHLSSSNGTRGSIFGLFFGVSSYYWRDFELSDTRPLLISELMKAGYRIQAYPSATLLNPDFAKMVFGDVPNLHIDTEGSTIYDRDCRLTENFINDLNADVGRQPTFSFLFYDMAHGYQVPAEKRTRFRPSWDYADYTALNNDTDPTPFRNLYKNCLFAIDSLVGRVLGALQQQGRMDNTIVVVTGDHGQEFNDNKQNYWGHNGNYSRAQIGVPFLYYVPDTKPRKVDYRTTHYDVSPTLLRDALGMTNDPSDVSMGRYLDDPTFRNWHIVGDNLNYAFIVEQDRIIEKKPSGRLEITDARLRPLPSYKPRAADLNTAIGRLNSFYK